jgi:hypothetical protein
VAVLLQRDVARGQITAVSRSFLEGFPGGVPFCEFQQVKCLDLVHQLPRTCLAGRIRRLREDSWRTELQAMLGSVTHTLRLFAINPLQDCIACIVQSTLLNAELASMRHHPSDIAARVWYVSLKALLHLCCPCMLDLIRCVCYDFGAPNRQHVPLHHGVA